MRNCHIKIGWLEKYFRLIDLCGGKGWVEYYFRDEIKRFLWDVDEFLELEIVGKMRRCWLLWQGYWVLKLSVHFFKFLEKSLNYKLCIKLWSREGFPGTKDGPCAVEFISIMSNLIPIRATERGKSNNMNSQWNLYDAQKTY